MLQAFRIVEEDALPFLEWAAKQGMEPITSIQAKDGTLVSLFRADRVFSDRDIAKSGLPVRQLNLPRFNFEVEDLDVLERIRAGDDPFFFGSESIKDYIDEILKQANPVTVHTKHDNQFYVIYPDPARGWKYAVT